MFQYLIPLIIFSLLIILSTFLIFIITKYARANRIIISILIILNTVFLVKYYNINYGSFVLPINELILLFTNYLIYIIYFFSKEKNITKKIKNNKDYNINVTLLLIYVFFYIISMMGLNFHRWYQDFLGADMFIICIIFIIRVYSYIYIHSFAEEIKEELPKWVTQFNDAYELAKKKEKKELFIWFYIIVYTLGIYANKYKVLSTIIFIIIFGPYLLISGEIFRIANSVRKILKKYNFYNYNVWLGVVSFIQVFLISMLLVPTTERWKVIISMF